MIPGEIIPAPGSITLNAGRPAITLMVANTGDRPVTPGLALDREAARGMRLDIPAGTAVRFEPGQRRGVRLVPFGGARQVWGFNGQVMGALDAG